MSKPLPSLDDVLDALPRLARPASVVVEAARLYLGARRGASPMTSRAVAVQLGVSHSTVQYWMRQLGVARSHSEATAGRYRALRRRGGCPIDEIAVRREYQAGDPVAVILARHKLAVDMFYRVLRRGGVPLRTHARASPSERQRRGIERRRVARERARQLGLVPGARDTDGVKRQIAAELGVSYRSVRLYLSD